MSSKMKDYKNKRTRRPHTIIHFINMPFYLKNLDFGKTMKLYLGFNNLTAGLGLMGWRLDLDLTHLYEGIRGEFTYNP